MSVAYARGLTLPWSRSGREEQLFRLITLATLAVALLLGAIVPLVELPERPRFERQELPPRLARLILEQRQQPTAPEPPELKLPEPPKPKPEKVTKPKEPAKVAQQTAPKPEPTKQPVAQPAQRSLEAARKKAAASGLLAFSDELADLRDNPRTAAVQQVQRLTRSGNKAARAQRAIIASAARQGSGGIDTATLSRDTGGAGLGERSLTAVESSALRGNGSGGAPDQAGASFKGNRSAEEIQVVFDQNKGAVYALYNRALRKDPGLRGKVVLQLTIAPSGEVTDCRILSSELNDKALERKLVARIKLFRFPSKDVDVAVVSYPIDFLPS